MDDRPPMQERSAKWIEKTVTEVISEFGLGKWAVTVDRKPLEDDADGSREASDAKNWADHTYQTLKLAFRSGFEDKTRDEQHELIVHETCHVFTAWADVVFGRTAEKIGPGAKVEAEASFEDAIEWATVSIARILQDRFPKPPSWMQKKRKSA